MEAALLLVLAVAVETAAAAAIVVEAGTAGTAETEEALAYLARYGYLSERVAADTAASLQGLHAAGPPPRRMARALSELQAFAGVPVTGLLDAETLALMRRPRCGNRDMEPEDEDELQGAAGNRFRRRREVRLFRRRRYVLHGSRWSTPRLTFRLSAARAGTAAAAMGAAPARGEVVEALRLWAAVSGLRFRPRARGPVNMQMSFHRRAHGDERDFDGAGGVLAHAFFPAYGGATHFDADERFVVHRNNTRRKEVSLRVTAAHELGHALGLEHSGVTAALMAPFYKPGALALHRDDIAAIQALYGPPPPPPEATAANSVMPEDEAGVGDDGLFQGHADRELCADPTVDAAFSTTDGSLHFFKGAQHYVTANGGGVVRGYPKSTAATWAALPLAAMVDAGFSLRGYDFLLAGGRVWRFRASALSMGFPVAIQNAFRGAPSSPDAAFHSHETALIYIFKGSQFWTISTAGKAALRARGPQPLERWHGLPSRLDAVLVDGNATFAIAGKQHWRLDVPTHKVAKNVPPYPHQNGQRWFGCP